MEHSSLSLNDRAGELVDTLATQAAALGLGLDKGRGGEMLLDCGQAHTGSTEAGLHLARICLANLAEVALVPSAARDLPGGVAVRTSQPALACLASQYAGWHLHRRDGTALMGSGPARALARREPLFDELTHREKANRAVLVIEGELPPDDAVASEVAQACGVPRPALAFLFARTGSFAGCAQIAARAIECAMQKARHLDAQLDRIVEARGYAPLASPHSDPHVAMGRANDAIIYAGRVELVLDAPPDAARALAHALPSCTAPDWGRAFGDVFTEANGDFARIDPALFSPAEVEVTALATGETFHAGRTDFGRLRGGADAG